jgi:hypothetical protein
MYTLIDFIYLQNESEQFCIPWLISFIYKNKVNSYVYPFGFHLSTRLKWTVMYTLLNFIYLQNESEQSFILIDHIYLSHSIFNGSRRNEVQIPANDTVGARNWHWARNCASSQGSLRPTVEPRRTVQAWYCALIETVQIGNGLICINNCAYRL